MQIALKGFDGLEALCVALCLRERVELVQFEPGEVVCAQGDEADRFFLIRIGFVKVSQESPGGEARAGGRVPGEGLSGIDSRGANLKRLLAEHRRGRRAEPEREAVGV